MGATFKQRYGISLSDLVKRAISPDHEVTAPSRRTKTGEIVNLALTEASGKTGEPRVS